MYLVELDPLEAFQAIQPRIDEEKKKKNLNFDIGGMAQNTRKMKRKKKQFYCGQSSRSWSIKHIRDKSVEFQPHILN